MMVLMMMMGLHSIGFSIRAFIHYESIDLIHSVMQWYTHVYFHFQIHGLVVTISCNKDIVLWKVEITWCMPWHDMT
jgi:hypothetical protein